jgi:hypothetical protein
LEKPDEERLGVINYLLAMMLLRNILELTNERV